jgi:glycosyltransferase involved in cell wall biosynthesis
MDLPNFPYKMPILNRLFVDAHYLLGLEGKLAGFDLVHTAETYFHYTQQALAAKRAGKVKKVIASVYENIPHNNEGIWGRKGFKARARQGLDHIVAISNMTRDALITEGADPSKISVVGHFIDTKRFAPQKDWLKRLGDKRRRKFRIVFVGRIEEYKGVLDIVSAMQQVAGDPQLAHYGGELLFVGNGSKLSTLKKLATTISPNWHSSFMSAKYLDMPKIYQSADIFVAPSKPTPTWIEQFNIALLEAQAAGLPIITTSTGGIPENVGDAARVVTPGDIDEISQNLRLFLTKPEVRVSYATAARQRARAVHDVSLGAKKIATIYQKVLAQ